VVTKFLLTARECFELDPQRITEAGGHLLSVGRIEDDGMVTVDVDVLDRESNKRLADLFASTHHG
jgi:hypothetical protein